MSIVQLCKNQILEGKAITKSQAMELYNQNLEELSKAANEIREHFCKNVFDICTIINAKSGRCSENCKYCAQSTHFDTNCEVYPLLASEEIIKHARYHAEKGILRYSLVTSGRNLENAEIDKVCQIIEELKGKVNIQICGSFGLLTKEQYEKLFHAGLKRIHNNLETSSHYFPKMCTTHHFEDKVSSITAAKEAGMNVCSGGIFGLGESVEDRIDLAFSLVKLGIKSVPINLLNPIQGTPCQSNIPLTDEELVRIVAIYRFILPDTFIRLAGGRGLLEDQGKRCFESGANAAISGDMLTTTGISVETDLQMVRKLEFEVKLHE